jgi:hypothetical protein
MSETPRFRTGNTVDPKTLRSSRAYAPLILVVGVIIFGVVFAGGFLAGVIAVIR